MNIATRTYGIISFSEMNDKLDELETTKKQLDEAVELIDSFSATDTCSHAPSHLWLNNWRNNVKIKSIKFLAKLSKEEGYEVSK